MPRRLPFYGALVSDTISLLGTRITMVALPWFVLTTTGSATQTGLVAAAQVAPMVLVKAASGPLIDRLGPRRVAIACDLLSVPVLAAIPLLHHLGHLSLPLLLVLVALAGSLSGPGDAAKGAMVPEIARVGELPLERVTGLSGAVERTASLVGLGLAGGLVALLGASNALYVDAATFAVAGVVVALCTRGIGAPAERPEAPTRYLAELREGWDHLRRDPVLVGICAMLAVTNFVDQAMVAVWMPVWARTTGHGVGAISLLLAVFAGASILGALTAAALGPRLPRFATYVVAFLITGAPRFVAYALGAPLWLLVAISVVAGAAAGFLNPILGAVILERIPAPLLGRVSALNTALCFSLMPLGGLLGGLAVSAWGFAPALVAGGALYLVATMAPVFVRSFRDFDSTRNDPSKTTPEPVSVAG